MIDVNQIHFQSIIFLFIYCVLIFFFFFPNYFLKTEIKKQLII